MQQLQHLITALTIQQVPRASIWGAKWVKIILWPLYAKQCNGILYDTIIYYTMPWYSISYHVTLYHAMVYYTMPLYIIPCHGLLNQWKVYCYAIQHMGDTLK